MNELPMLSRDDWSLLEALFDEGSQLPEAERPAFIARATADRPDLATALAAMLEHAATAGDRIERVVAGVARTVTPASPWVGRRFGPYRIEREIGRGGMGLVFEAVRDDDYRKRVALKVAPWAADMTIVADRFRLERQILANLEHPHIARLLDGGTDHGLPFFAMEYVEGVPIDEYCRRQRLDLRSRLTLLRQVAAAVHFAHERLVVHRDLKPSNILVGADGTPKLLDFGIAKLLDPVTDAARTLTAAPMWTPDFSSPEQVQGRAVTVRTDVYSLGLVIYEVLTDTRAQRADTSSPAMLERSICEGEPPPPSAAALARGDAALARALRGDLDTIVMTAINKEPKRRYASVAAVSDDLERHLDRRPVLARPSTVSYRLSRLLRRHRGRATAAGLLAASIVAGLVATVYQARRAERRFQEVRTLANAFVYDVHDRIEALPGATEARKAIVQTALTYLENLGREASGDSTLAVELATAYEKVGDAQGNPLKANLGDSAGALASYRRAEEIVRPVATTGDRKAQARLVSVNLRIATMLRTQGDVKGAMVAYQQAREIGERLLALAPADPAVLTLVGEAHADTSRAAFQLGDVELAASAARRSMEVARTLVDIEPSNRNHRDNLASGHNALGAVLITAGRIEEAAENFRASTLIREALVKEEPTRADIRRNLLISYGNLGDVLGYRTGENLGDIAGAAAAYEKSGEIAQWIVSQDPADRRAVFDLSNVALRLGTLLLEDPAQAAAALAHLQEAERLNDRLLAQDPTSDRYRYVAAVLHRRTGEALMALHRDGEAARRLQRARSEALTHIDGPNRASARQVLVFSSLRLATLQARRGDPAAREVADSAAGELARAPLGPPSTEALAYAELGRVYLVTAKQLPSEARADVIRKAISALERGRDAWRAAKLAAPLEPRRTAALTSIESDLAECRRQLDGGRHG